jgi:hypothetical protein
MEDGDAERELPALPPGMPTTRQSRKQRGKGVKGVKWGSSFMHGGKKSSRK